MNVLAAIRWFGSVGFKVFRVGPRTAGLVVLCTLASQICSLLAALLPLKVIILLGSDHIPSYFPPQLQDYGKTVLIVGLGLAALAFFGLHLLTEWLTARLSVYGARTLITHSRKLTLFENQEQLLSRAYQRFASALAGGVFIFLAATALTWIYPLQSIVVVGYAVLVWAALALRFRFSTTWRERHEGELIRLVGVLANLGFFITFATIVLDVLLGTQVSVLWAIVTLLLVRQLFRRLSVLVSDVAGLYLQRLQLNALLFQGHIYVGKARPADAAGVWALAHPDNCRAWLPSVIGRVAETIDAEPQIRWVQSGMPDVLMGVSQVLSQGHERSYLIKIFGKNRSAQARHEASLFGAMNADTAPLPRLCLVDQVGNFNCHVFDWPALEPIVPREAKRAATTVTAELFAARPSPSLVALFTRSRPMLWQRLDEKILDRLHLFTRDAELALVKRFEDVLGDIQASLKEMPLAIITPELTPDTLWCDSQGMVWASQWGRWSLEPAGAGWPINEKALPMLPAAFIKAQSLRSDLRSISTHHVELAALVYAFDRACQRQVYRTAVELIAPMLSAYSQLQESAPNDRKDFSI
jgi:hypothetical protein